MKRIFKSNATRITLSYLIFGAVWIILSDKLVEFFVSNSSSITTAQTYKGWAFIIVTSLLLFFLLEKVFRILQNEIEKHKTAIILLKDSENKYRGLYDNLRDAFASADMNGNIIEYNSEFARMLSYNSEEIKNLTYKDITPVRWHKFEDEIINHQVLIKGYSDIYEKEYRRKDGTIFPVELRTILITDSEKRPKGMWAIIRDITNRKRAEEELRRSRKEFQTYYNSSSIGLSVTAADKTWIEVNQRLCEMFGYTKDELTGLTWENLTHPEDLPENLKLNQQALDGKIDSYELDKRFIRKDGSIVYVTLSIVCIRNDDGSLHHFLASYNDITERKRAQEALQESEERFRTLYENSTIGLYRTTPGGEILLANPTLVRLLGYSSFEELAFRNLNKDGFEPDYDRKLFIERIDMDGEVKGFESAWTRKDGTIIYVLESAKALRDSNGKILYYDGSVEDITERKRAEDELLASKLIIEGIINSIPVRVFWKDKNLVFLGCNTIFAADAGFSNPQEIIGKDDYQMGWRDQAELYRNDDRKVIESGKSRLLIEEPQTTPEGKTITLLTSKIPLRDSKGEITGLLGTYIDITDRKLAEEKLEESEERFRVASESLTDIIYDWDIKEKIDWYGDIDGLMGYSPGEFPRTLEAWAVSVHPEDKDRVWAALESHLKGMAPYIIEYRIARKDGELRWWSVRGIALRNDRGEPYKMIGSITDITERKQAEEKIREKDIQFRKLSSQVPDLIFQFTRRPDGTYFVPIASEGIKSIFGCSPEDVLEDFTPIGKVIYPEDSERVISDIEYSAKHLSMFTCEFRVQIPGKPIQWIYSKSKPEKLADGSTTWYGFNTDITERKIVESELIASKEKAEEMSRLKSNFLANMSHELRTPLVGILGYADFLRQDAESREKREMAETIFNSGTRLSETLNLILDLSRFETEKKDIKYQKIDIVSKAKEIITLFNETANKKGLSLKSAFSQDSIIINFEERAFHSILNNLINNAIKFTSEGSITTTISLINDFVEMKVMDTGIGIAEQNYHSIFEEFHQVSEGYSRNFEGSGLGLSITKKLVEKFGGTITVESEIGKGSTFKVILPVISTEETEKELTIKEIKIIPKSPKLKSVKPLALVVDDDPFVFTVLKSYTSEYLELDSTVDAEFAFKKLKKKQYDLIFMDINLRRGMDGKEATKKIRTMKGYESIPIVASTAYAMVGDKEEFLAAGCTHYLSKPFSRKEIEELLEKILKHI